jgi:hypothetical protein
MPSPFYTAAVYADEIADARRHRMRPFAACSGCGHRHLLHLTDLLCDICHTEPRRPCPNVSSTPGSGDGCIIRSTKPLT